MSILVVDDCREGREIFKVVLTKGGYSDVIALESATAAFSFLGLDAADIRDTPPVDLILFDVVLPDLDGIQACARVRRDARYVHVPIVMVTGLDDMEIVDKAFKNGATDYLTKPLKAVDLLACVRAKALLKAELDRRNARERELMEHLPLSFDCYELADERAIDGLPIG